VGVDHRGPDLSTALTHGWADELISAIEERALWARFGL